MTRLIFTDLPPAESLEESLYRVEIRYAYLDLTNPLVKSKPDSTSLEHILNFWLGKPAYHPETVFEPRLFEDDLHSLQSGNCEGYPSQTPILFKYKNISMFLE